VREGCPIHCPGHLPTNIPRQTAGDGPDHLSPSGIIVAPPLSADPRRMDHRQLHLELGASSSNVPIGFGSFVPRLEAFPAATPRRASPSQSRLKPLSVYWRSDLAAYSMCWRGSQDDWFQSAMIVPPLGIRRICSHHETNLVAVLARSNKSPVVDFRVIQEPRPRRLHLPLRSPSVSASTVASSSSAARPGIFGFSPTRTGLELLPGLATAVSSHDLRSRPQQARSIPVSHIFIPASRPLHLLAMDPRPPIRERWRRDDVRLALLSSAASPSASLFAPINNAAYGSIDPRTAQRGVWTHQPGPPTRRLVRHRDHRHLPDGVQIQDRARESGLTCRSETLLTDCARLGDHSRGFMSRGGRMPPPAHPEWPSLPSRRHRACAKPPRAEATQPAG